MNKEYEEFILEMLKKEEKEMDKMQLEYEEYLKSL
jgi:hypothetical protein